jgi:hypothetical protein
MVATQALSNVAADGANPPIPTLHWNLTTTQIDAGAPVGATIRYARLPAGAKILVERRYGTANQLGLVVKYAASGSGTRIVTLPSVALGSYMYQVEATTLKGKVIARTPFQRLLSYGNVPLSSLCKAAGATIGGDDCQGGNVQVGSNLFVYAIAGNSGRFEPPKFGTIVNFPATTCRTIDLTFTLDSNASQPGETADIQIIQVTTAPEVASTAQGIAGTLAATLDGGPFYIQNSATSGDNIYYNGTANCWSASGV